MIKTVVERENDYKVQMDDGTIYASVPKCGGNIEYEMVKSWLLQGNEPEPEFSQEELDVQKQVVLKQAKANKLNTIVVEVDGIALDGNEVARANMMSAIMSAEIIGQTESPWKLADNTVEIVTISELKQALALSIQEVGRIVMVTSIEEL